MPLPVLALLLVVFGLTTGEFVIAGILPDVAADLSVSVPAAGLAVTAYALGMIIGGPVVTVATARVRRKALIVGLVAVSVAGNLGSALAPGYPALLLARFVAGSVVATFFALAIATAVSLATPGRAASMVAKVALGMNLGIIAGTPLGSWIGHQVSWRASFASVAVFTAAALVVLARVAPPLPPAATGSVRGELRVFTRRELQLALALTALGNVGVVTVFSYIAPLLTQLSGFRVADVPVLLLVYGAGAVAGNVAGGWAADRALMPSLIALLAALAAALALFGVLASHRAAAVALTFLVGALAFAVIPGMQTRVMATASAAATLAVAVNASGFQLAAAFAGWLGGRVIDSRWGLTAIYPTAAGLTVLGLAVAVHAHRRDHRPPAPTGDPSAANPSAAHPTAAATADPRRPSDPPLSEPSA